MGSVRQLSKDLIDRIAAGEVIERPASVVKELMENAIDARATSITIAIEEAGIGLISIVDNGCGMDESDLCLAVKRHATSKLKTSEDLFAIQTLGFRGEALPSIAAVSRMTIASRTAGTPHGGCLVLEGGEVCEQGKRAMPEGTILEIRDLFFNTPARKKFLKTTATEQKNILDIITRYALVRADISFKVSMDGRTMMQLASGMDLAQRLGILMGADFKSKMLSFAREETGISVHGMLAPPEINRAVRSGILCFVNNRAVRDTTLSAAVGEGYRGLLMRNRYPVAVLFADINPAEVDVNVHPAKAEVRFQNPGRVFGLIVAAVRETLNKPRSPLPYRRASLPSGSSPYPFPRQDQPANKAVQCVQTDYAISATDFYSHLAIIGTLHDTYILLEDANSLFILDQHAAHERVIYEQLKNRSHQDPVQMLLHPLLIDVSPGEYAVFEKAAPTLSALGIDCEPFGAGSIAVRSVPQALSSADIKDLILTMLQDISVKHPADPREEILASMACHKSLRSGRRLTTTEITALLERLDQTGAPRTCPHGRPIFKEITLEEIARWIGRRP